MFGIPNPPTIHVSGAGQIKPLVIAIREGLGLPYWVGDSLAEGVHQLIAKAMEDCK